MAPTRILSTLCGAMLVLLLGGCTGTGHAAPGAPSDEASAARSRAGASSTAAASPAAGSSLNRVAALALAARVETTVRAAGMVHVTLSQRRGPRAEGDVRVTGPTAVSLHVRTATQRVRVLLLGERVYVAGYQGLPADRWLRFSTTGSTPLAQALTPLAREVREGTDPHRVVLALAAGRVTDLGPTTGAAGGHRYRVVVPDGAGTAATGLTAVVTLDAAGRPSRAVVTARSAPGRPLTVTYSRWGAPVRIGPPPAPSVLAV